MIQMLWYTDWKKEITAYLKKENRRYTRMENKGVFVEWDFTFSPNFKIAKLSIYKRSLSIKGDVSTSTVSGLQCIFVFLIEKKIFNLIISTFIAWDITKIPQVRLQVIFMSHYFTNSSLNPYNIWIRLISFIIVRYSYVGNNDKVWITEECNEGSSNNKHLHSKGMIEPPNFSCVFLIFTVILDNWCVDGTILIRMKSWSVAKNFETRFLILVSPYGSILNQIKKQTTKIKKNI